MMLKTFMMRRKYPSLIQIKAWLRTRSHDASSSIIQLRVGPFFLEKEFHV